ncbi:MAG: hypothetical protein ACP5O8_02340 [Candidatus Aenigmatarchaeota archaeon]
MKGITKLCLVGLVVTLLLAVLWVQRYGFAYEVSVNATAENVAPTVGALTITPSTISPGTTFYVAANVSDSNGKEDIIQVNVSCFGTGGTEWQDSWDSIKHLNDSYINWTPVDTTTWLINATFNTSVTYWSTKSINGTWTCKVYANDSGGLSAVNSASMTVNPFAGISLYADSCVFDSGAPGDQNKTWGCPTSSNRNNTVVHEGNTWINVTINATNLVGKTNPSWFIGFGNMTWNQTTGEVPTSKQGYQFSGSPMDFISFWARGSFPTYSATNATLWLDYPTPLYLQTYEGNITFSALVA